jgi:hypothetical protein
MRRHCAYEPGYFDDSQFLVTSKGIVHQRAPFHYINGTPTRLPTVDPSAALVYWHPYDAVIRRLVLQAPEPPEAFELRTMDTPRRRREDIQDDGTALRVEILQLTDRLSPEDLRTIRDLLRWRLDSAEGESRRP